MSPHVNANPKLLGDVFTDYVAYLRHLNTLVESTHQLEKAEVSRAWVMRIRYPTRPRRPESLPLHRGARLHTPKLRTVK